MPGFSSLDGAIVSDHVSWSLPENTWQLDSGVTDGRSIAAFKLPSKNILATTPSDDDHHLAMDTNNQAHNSPPRIPLDTTGDKHKAFHDTMSTTLWTPSSPSESCPSLETSQRSQEIAASSQRVPSESTTLPKLPASPVSPVLSMASSVENLSVKGARYKNRVAAAKYRRKFKRWVGDLHRREKELSVENEILRLQVNDLRNEVITLKAEILQHSTCESDVIQAYIRYAAEQVRQKYARTRNPSLPTAPVIERAPVVERFGLTAAPDGWIMY